MFPVFCSLHVFQCKTKYPKRQLTGEAIRGGAVKQLLAPVLELGDRVYAFRVAWRLNGAPLRAAWRTIVQLRELCDNVMRGAESVAFFVSSISGVYTTPSERSGATKDVYPAVSYWMVSDGRATPFDDRQMTQTLLRVVPSADIKRIVGKRNEQEALSGPLFVVLKDHNSGYIHRRIAESRHQLSLPARSTADSYPVRLVAVQARYARHLATARRTLAAVGLWVCLKTDHGTGTD